MVKSQYWKVKSSISNFHPDFAENRCLVLHENTEVTILVINDKHLKKNTLKWFLVFLFFFQIISKIAGHVEWKSAKFYQYSEGQRKAQLIIDWLVDTQLCKEN